MRFTVFLTRGNSAYGTLYLSLFYWLNSLSSRSEFTDDLNPTAAEATKGAFVMLKVGSEYCAAVGVNCTLKIE